MLLVRLEDFVKFAEFLFQVAGIDRVEPFEETHHFELHLLHVVHLYEEYVHRADLVVDVVVDSRFVGTDQVEDARIALQVAAVCGSRVLMIRLRYSMHGRSCRCRSRGRRSCSKAPCGGAGPADSNSCG